MANARRARPARAAPPRAAPVSGGQTGDAQDVPTLRIARLGHRGDGIAAGPAGPVYVPLTLPGETVSGQVQDARMRDPKVLDPSPNRVPAPCPHYARCGGCALMHADDAFVARWKVQIVAQALAAQGIGTGPDAGTDMAAMKGIATSPPMSRRRAVLAARRDGADVTLGFHARASARIVDVHHCLVVRPAILAAFPLLRQLVAAGVAKGAEAQINVLETPAGLDVTVTGGLAAEGARAVRLAQLAQAGAAVPAPDDLAGATGQVAGQIGGLARLTWGDRTVMLARPPAVRMGRAQVVPPPGGFLQATAQGQAALTAVVRQALTGASRVADLFAGCGTFSLPAAETADVLAVEGLAAPLAALDAAWRATPRLHRITTQLRDLAARPLDMAELARFDAIVIDPPRSGALAQAEMLARSTVPVVAWVSCDPVTFARDAARMVAGGYTLDGIWVVDQFRWSPHVETAAIFRRR